MQGKMVSDLKEQESPQAKEPAFFSRQIAEARRFFLRLNQPKPEGFEVICGGSEHCTPDYHIKRKGFPYVTIEFVAQGEGHLVLNGTSHNLITGAVFAYGPGVSMDMRCDRRSPMTKYFVNFGGS